MQRMAIEFFASFLIWFLYAGLVYFWFIDGRIKREQVLHAILASITAWLISEALKRIVPTPRPFLLDGLKPLVVTTWDLNNGAFPSTHTALAFALSTTIWLHDRRVGWMYLIFSILIGIARVMANVHYPLDIFGGALIGVLSSFAVDRLHLFGLLKRKSKRS